MNNDSKRFKNAIHQLRYLPHLMFVPGWIYLINRILTTFIEYPSGSNNIFQTKIFVFVLFYLVLNIHIISLILIIWNKGKPYWAISLHVLFALFLILALCFFASAAGFLNGFQL